jgi:hypothetical protein
MKVIKRHPLALLILFVLFGMLGGNSAYQRESARWSQGDVIAELYWQSDERANLFMALWGFVGGMVGLAIGMAGYVIIKRNRPEPSLSLKLRDSVSSK